MEHLKENMSEKSKRLLQLSTDKGVSNWFTMSPIAKYGFEFSKQQFWEYMFKIWLGNLKIANDVSMWKQIWYTK